MDYSGPTTLAMVEEDLRLSDDELVGPRVLPQGANRLPLPNVPGSSQTTATSTKRILEDLNTSEESLAPASKTVRVGVQGSATGDHFPPLPARHVTPHRSVPAPHRLALPAFAPREDYVKLMFPENPSANIKLRWLAEVTRVFGLDQSLAEVKMSAVTSRFVYVARKRQDIVERVEAGEFLAMRLVKQDSPARPRKLPSYLVSRYPVGVDPSLSTELAGVYNARRFHHNGKAINKIVVTWNAQMPPPTTYTFSFLPCLPACEISLMRVDQPTCYKCWGVGHISTYCVASEKCAWCAGPHDSRTCQHRGPPPPPPAEDGTTAQAPTPSADVTSNWRCPRCNEAGVSVWHGCSRRRTIAASTPVSEQAPRPPPPTRAGSPLDSHPASPSPQVLALRSAVEELKKRYAAFETRLDALESRLDTIEGNTASLITGQASMEASITTLMEAQHTLIATVSSLTERLETLIPSQVGLSSRPPSPSHSSPRPLPHSSKGSSLKKHSVR